MKKSKISVLGVLVLLSVLFFTLVGCDNSTGDVPKSIRITGIVGPNNTSANVHVDLNAGDHNQQGQGEIAQGHSIIVNQTALVELYTLDSNRGITDNPWTGSGQWCIRLKFFDSTDNHQHDYIWKDWQKYDIRDAVTELNFADFVLVWHEVDH